MKLEPKYLIRIFDNSKLCNYLHRVDYWSICVSKPISRILLIFICCPDFYLNESYFFQGPIGHEMKAPVKIWRCCFQLCSVSITLIDRAREKLTVRSTLWACKHAWNNKVTHHVWSVSCHLISACWVVQCSWNLFTNEPYILSHFHQWHKVQQWVRNFEAQTFMMQASKEGSEYQTIILFRYGFRQFQKNVGLQFLCWVIGLPKFHGQLPIS